MFLCVYQKVIPPPRTKRAVPVKAQGKSVQFCDALMDGSGSHQNLTDFRLMISPSNQQNIQELAACILTTHVDPYASNARRLLHIPVFFNQISESV